MALGTFDVCMHCDSFLLRFFPAVGRGWWNRELSSMRWRNKHLASYRQEINKYVRR